MEDSLQRQRVSMHVPSSSLRSETRPLTVEWMMNMSANLGSDGPTGGVGRTGTALRNENGSLGIATGAWEAGWRAAKRTRVGRPRRQSSPLPVGFSWSEWPFGAAAGSPSPSPEGPTTESPTTDEVAAPDESMPTAWCPMWLGVSGGVGGIVDEDLTVAIPKSLSSTAMKNSFCF